MKNINKILNKYAESVRKSICNPDCMLGTCRPQQGYEPIYWPPYGIEDMKCNSVANDLMGACNLCTDNVARRRCQGLVRQLQKACNKGVRDCKAYKEGCSLPGPDPTISQACSCFVESCHVSGLQDIIEDAYGACDFFLDENFDGIMRDLERNRNYNLQSCKRTLDVCTKNTISPEGPEIENPMDDPPITSI